MKASSGLRQAWIWSGGLSLALAGVLTVHVSFWTGLGLLLAAGLALGLAGPEAGLTERPKDWPRGREALALGLLFLFSAAIRLWRLDLYPAGPGFVESVMGLDVHNLAQSPYTPHLTEPQATFPSLLYYQGLLSTRLLGWGVAALRVPAALWGALAVLAFFLLLRQCCSLPTALLFSLLFSVNNLQLTLSRLFFPGTLLFFSAAATAAFLLRGFRRGGAWPFLAAGFSCGLALHGYVPGRLLPPFFLAWVGLAWIQGRWSGRRRPDALQVGLFLGALLLAAAPVLLWAWRNPTVYWTLVQHNGGARPWAALQDYVRTLPEYLRMFYTRADAVLEPTDGLARYPLLRPDALAQALLPAGLVLALLRPGRPVSWLLLGGFFAGLAPAALAGNYPPPCTRRALLVLPWAYLAAALAWEQLLATAPEAPGQVLRRGLRWLGWTLGGLAVLLSLQQYFVKIMARPSVRSAFNVAGSLAAAEMRAHPGQDLRVGYDLVAPGTVNLVFYKDTSQRRIPRFQDFDLVDWSPARSVVALKQLEDFLTWEQPGPRLLLLPPYLEAAEPWLRTILPGADIQVLREPRDFRSGMNPWDPFAPITHFVRVALSAEQAASLRGLVDLSLPPYALPKARVAAWDPGFAEARAGQRLDLGGLLVQQLAGASVRFSCGWPGWMLELDGRPVGWGKELAVDQGSHRLRLRGPVPAKARGALPLRVECQGDELGGMGRILPIDPRYGLACELRPAGQPQAAPLRRYEPLPIHRFYPPEGVNLPADAVWSARLAPRQAGRYSLSVRPPFHGRISVGGQVVYDSLAGGDPRQVAVDLDPRRPVPLKVECRVDAEYDHVRTLILDVRAQGEGEASPLPWDWVLAP